MREIIPILELVSVDSLGCGSCYYRKDLSCIADLPKDKNGNSCVSSENSWNIWKEVTK